MAEKQIEFDPIQTHVKRFEQAMIAVSPRLHRDRRRGHPVHDLGEPELSPHHWV